MRILSWCCCLIAIFFVGYTILQYTIAVEEPPLGEAITLPEPDMDLGFLPIAEGNCIKIHLMNRSSESLRVVGMSQACGQNVCYHAKDTYYVIIPAHGEVDYECMLSIRSAGPFKITATLFVDDNGLRKIPVTLRGVGK